ncbi:hypothetical protein BC828DRAFT_391761 [Blastocladiella britannica]|nr:hypothetical protein BC828DRAFT_391761 [Blastocladiella britannica]
MPGLAMLDIIPTTDDYQVTGSSASGCLATPTTSSGGAGFGVVPDGENPRVGVTALSIGFETVDERSAWIRAIEKAANHQVSRGAHTAVSFRKVKIGSSLKNALGRLSDSRSGAMAAASSGMPGPMRMLSGSDLPVSTVSPHDMPDGVDFLVRTLAEHKPASQFEIGFHKHTYLRVLNDSRSDLWKVAISRVVGLVPRSLVARVEADPAQYQQLMAACRREGALSWIEYAGECDATLRPTAMVAGIQHQRQRSQIDLALANMDTPPLADTPLVGQSVGREPPRKSRKLLPSFGHKRSRSLGLSSASLATVNVLSDPSSAVGVQPRSSTPAPDGVRVEKVEGRHGWVRIHNANQSRPYFHNESKKLTVWELPAESAADEEDL